MGRSPGDHAEPDAIRGQAIGRYVVLERLGAGGMGVVFSAFDPELGRRVAIKVLHMRHTSEASQARLVREAQALAQITHPCVVAVHDVGLHDGRVFLAMEYVEGQTLRGYMADTADGSVGIPGRLAVLIAAGEGLAAAHRAGLVHRDFKPDNVMIGDRGEVKVMDFGLARIGDGEIASAREREWSGVIESGGTTSQLASSGDLTEAGAVMGTPAYMAPEQLAGLAADTLSDQFAFAVTAYEALFGARPFKGANLAALALVISEGSIYEPKSHAVPAWLRRVIRRGLASDPAQRWPDLDSMLAAMANDPVRSRRRRWLAGAALGLSASAGALATWLLATPAPPANTCELVAGVEAHWSPSARAQLERALGPAPSTITVLGLLDTYALAWDAAAADNCASSHAEPRQSDQVHELRAGCLRHRRIAFDALVAALGEDAGARQQAVEAAAGLPAIGTCSDIAALELEPLLPTDPDLRADVEALGDQLAAVESLVQMRRSEIALPRAHDLAMRADALAYAPTQAEAALLLGRALTLDDELERGVASLRRAYFTAMSCGHVLVQTQAATELVYTVGYLQQDHERGGEWAEHALSIVARTNYRGSGGSGGSGTLIEADVQHALGVLRDSSGDHIGSLNAYTKAYEIRKRLLPASHPDLARSLNALGMIHHALGDFDGSRDFYQRALDMRIELFGPEHPIVAGSLNNLALTMRDLGELERAKVLLERAIAVSERAGGQHGNGLARALTNLADLERRLHALGRARELEQRSLAIRRATVGDDHPEVADSIVSLARIARDAGELEQAQQLARDGVARLQRDFAPGHPETFSAIVVLASVLERQGQHAEVVELLRGALERSRTEDLEPEDLREAKLLLGDAVDHP